MGVDFRCCGWAMLQADDHLVIELDSRLSFGTRVGLVNGRELFVTEQFARDLVITGSDFEKEFGGCVAELVGRQRDAGFTTIHLRAGY